jgi:hypothetical protein
MPGKLFRIGIGYPPETHERFHFVHVPANCFFREMELPDFVIDFDFEQIVFAMCDAIQEAVQQRPASAIAVQGGRLCGFEKVTRYRRLRYVSFRQRLTKQKAALRVPSNFIRRNRSCQQLSSAGTPRSKIGRAGRDPSSPDRAVLATSKRASCRGCFSNCSGNRRVSNFEEPDGDRR